MQSDLHMHCLATTTNTLTIIRRYRVCIVCDFAKITLSFPLLLQITAIYFYHFVFCNLMKRFSTSPIDSLCLRLYYKKCENASFPLRWGTLFGSSLWKLYAYCILSGVAHSKMYRQWWFCGFSFNKMCV